VDQHPRQPPRTWTAIGRGLTRRCPWCGSGKLFRRWFVMVERCPSCGFRLDQGDGAFLGAMAINYGVAGTLFIATLIIWVAATAPDVPVLPLLLVSLGVTGGAILLFYPFSKTLWAAIDLMLHRMDRADREMHDAGTRSSDIEAE
jgi:uncharacterized protein (DUF983 family)